MSPKLKPRPRTSARPAPKRSLTVSDDGLFKPLFDSPARIPPPPSREPSPEATEPDLVAPLSPPHVKQSISSDLFEESVIEFLSAEKFQPSKISKKGKVRKAKSTTTATLQSETLDGATPVNLAPYRILLLVGFFLFMLPSLARTIIVNGGYSAPEGHLYIYDRTHTLMSLAEDGWELKKTRLGGHYKVKDSGSGKCLSLGKKGTATLKRCFVARAWKMTGDGNLLTKKGKSVEALNVALSIPGWGAKINIESFDEAWELLGN
ncbi:hypothetical protein TrVE_jg5973 [Triparma verrucosa]|uniref:Uncharacterized protein n=1 Tax=Triparma verrucosa TaxID=1606542 RepID=A0A9W7BH88_9STRA|nr:hypothetical protein TrVE_jg5973 [Triparma verrucosa]